MKNIIPFLIFFLLFQLTIAQPSSTYLVIFKDKNASPYSINKPSDYLSEKAITPPRLIAQNVFPSPEIVEVTAITFD